MASAVAPFLRMKGPELYAALAAGHPIDPGALDDTEYKGTSLGVPAFVEKLTWKKFKKVFCRDADTGALRGWNVRLEQNELAGPCIPKKRGGEIFTFGHYAVVDLAGYRVPAKVPHGLMLDYGLGGNPPFDTMAPVRDPLVAVKAGDASVLLGWSYVDFGWIRLRTPSFFLLEYDGPLSHRIPPPRRPRAALPSSAGRPSAPPLAPSE